MSVDQGTLYRSTLVGILDANGAAINPGSVTFTVTLPDQTTATATTVSDGAQPGGAGWAYHADYLTAQEGLHRGQWVTTVPNITRTDYFNVTAYRALVGLDEVKIYLGINDTRWDDKLRSLIAAATSLVEEKCGTCVIRTITNDWITGGDREVIRLPHAPLPTAGSVVSIASVYSGGPKWLTADLIVNPEVGTCRTVNMQGFYYGPWQATYTAGRRIMPSGIITGCEEILWDVWSIHRNLFGDMDSPDPEDVAQMEATLAIPQNYRIPIRALEFLDPHTMPGFA